MPVKAWESMRPTSIAGFAKLVELWEADDVLAPPRR